MAEEREQTSVRHTAGVQVSDSHRFLFLIEGQAEPHQEQGPRTPAGQDIFRGHKTTCLSCLTAIIACWLSIGLIQCFFTLSLPPPPPSPHFHKLFFLGGGGCVPLTLVVVVRSNCLKRRSLLSSTSTPRCTHGELPWSPLPPRISRPSGSGCRAS